jgi:hypothetical protein
MSGLCDPGWECDKCGHVNDDAAEECAGAKCVEWRKWAASQPQDEYGTAGYYVSELVAARKEIARLRVKYEADSMTEDELSAATGDSVENIQQDRADAARVLAWLRKRTPERVLRAMAQVYGDAEIRARIADYGRPQAKAMYLHAFRDSLVNELAKVANEHAAVCLWHPELQSDYEARLRGDRPLDAPPPEMP